MSVVTIFSGAFCQEDAVFAELEARTGYRLIRDADVAAEAARLGGTEESRIRNAFSSKVSIFNRFTHEKERSMAFLRLAVAQRLAEDGLLLAGYAGMMIPPEVSHVLRICLVAELKSRCARAMQERGLSEREAVQEIQREDQDRSAWIEALYDNKDPWDSSLYDIVVPVDKIQLDGVGALIKENLAKDVVWTTEQSRSAVADFLLAAQVGVALTREGHPVEVKAASGEVTLVINKQVLMLSRLEEELKGIVSKVPGVRSVATRVGKKYHQTDVYRKFDFAVPSKVLLVDDEREFVQTLSERLQMREMGSAVAYDGESALDLVREDDPEVMILDLKMPGIDGIEVLRRVKETRPSIEVIILTGHGSDADRETCMKLGAFAYLQKPVDIELLSRTLKEANEKIRRRSGGGGEGSA